MKRKNVSSPGGEAGAGGAASVTATAPSSKPIDQSVQFQFAVHADHHARNPELLSQDKVAAMNQSFLKSFGSSSNRRQKSRHTSPTLPTGSFEQQQLHRMVKMKKLNQVPQASQANSSLLYSNNSPEERDTPQPVHQPQHSQPRHQAAGRMTHQQARTMRISQQRILKESSQEAVPANFDNISSTNPLPQSDMATRTVTNAEPGFSSSNQRNFASEGLSFASLSEHTGHKLVKKVAMKGSMTSQNIGQTEAVLKTVRQSSLTHRQGPILQSGPHTRSKSSAVGAVDTSMQMQQQRPSRKSNSRGRGTPQNRVTQVQPPVAVIQHQGRKAKKQSAEQVQKASITITSPKDSSADLNTSMPLPLSKSHNRMMHLDKHQTSVGNGRQHQVFKPGTSAQQQQAQPPQQPIASAGTKAVVTPSGATYQHTRKQSATRHRSNSKKRGSINTSIRRQISRSPAANQRANSLAGNVHANHQASQHSKASIKNNQSAAQALHHQSQNTQATSATGAKLTLQWSKEQQQPGGLIHQSNQLIMDQQMAALAASAFNQQHSKSNSQEQIVLRQPSAPVKSRPVKQKQSQGSGELAEQLVLAVSAALNPPQGHRLTPLVQSNKTGRSSNERKNRSMLYDATSVPQNLDPDSHKSETKLSEPAQKLVGVDLQTQQHVASNVIIDDPKQPLQQQHDFPKLQQNRSNVAEQEIIMKSTAAPKKVQKYDPATRHHQALPGSTHQTANSGQGPQFKAGGEQSQAAASSQFSSFTKDHVVVAQMRDAKHQSAQKILRPKNSFSTAANGGAASEVSAHSPSENGVVWRGAGVGPQGAAGQSQQQAINQSQQQMSVYAQPQAQVMQLLKQSRQGGGTSSTLSNPVPMQQRMSHNLPGKNHYMHQQSTTSSAQSSRTAHDVYLKQALKKNALVGGPLLPSSQAKAMSSRTVNSVSSGVTPYEPGRAQTAQSVVQELYGSSQAANKPLNLAADKGSDNKSSKIAAANFVDFRPKTSIGTNQGESRSQMLDCDVEGLSPEPRAEIILSKNQIQRAAKAKIQGQSQIIAVPKQEGNRGQQNLQKLKVSQIQQVSQSNPKDLSKKVVKSQRPMHQPKHHAKSFSNCQPGAVQNYLYFESKNLSALNANYLNQAQQPAQNSATNQDVAQKDLSQSRPFAAKSASKVQQHAAQSMIQNWVYSADQAEEASVVSSADQPKKQQFHKISLGQTTRQKYGGQQAASVQDSQHTRSLFSSEHTNNRVEQSASAMIPPHAKKALNQQTTKSQRGGNANTSAHSQNVFGGGGSSQFGYQPQFAMESADEQQHSQRVLVQNSHQLSQGPVPAQHLKSVQVTRSGPGADQSQTSSTFKPGGKVLKTGRSTKESILQAEQSHQKILGPIVTGSASSQGGASSNGEQNVAAEGGKNGAEHNAYANNAEDYFKKGVAAAKGTKTPGEKPTKKLEKVSGQNPKGAHNGAQQAQKNSNGMAPLAVKKKASAKASPNVNRQQQNLIDEDGNRLLETQSALTVTAPNSFVSQGSQQNNNAVSTSNSVIHDSKSLAMSRSRLSQFVLQSNAAKQSTSGGKNSYQQSAVSAGSSSMSKTPMQQMGQLSQQSSQNNTASSMVKKTVLSSNQVQMVTGKKAQATANEELKAQTSLKGGKAAQTQSELMRKKNQAKMVGASALSAKQQQNLQMQHFINKKEDSQAGQRPAGTGTVLQKDPDTTLLSASTQSRLQQPNNSKVSPSALPNNIHQQLMGSSASNAKQQKARPGHHNSNQQQQPANAGSKKAKSSEQIYASNQRLVEAKDGKPTPSSSSTVKNQQQYMEYLQNQSASQILQQSDMQRSAKPSKTGLSRIDGLAMSEARSQTVLVQENAGSHENLSQHSRYNLSQPARPITEFEAASRGASSNQLLVQSANSQGITPNSDSLGRLHQNPASLQQHLSLTRYEINEGMPQRLNLANMLERVDKKLGKNELLLTSQLSTTTSHSSSSFLEDKASQSSRQNNSRFNQQPQPGSQVLNHLVTFDAHANSVMGLQAMSINGPNQFASFAKDNTVKVWSVTTQKPTELISNNRAAAVNLLPKVVLKRQIRNQTRPSQKLSSFAFMSAGPQQTQSPSVSDSQQRSVLVTGCTDKVLRLYALDSPEPSDAYQRLDYAKRKDGFMASADVMQPSLRLTGQHRGVISSIVQLPAVSNDFFLTGCSDGQIRMYSLSALSEETDEPICSFDQGTTGVQQICPMSENTFLSSGHDNTVRLWDVRLQEHQRLLKDPNFGKVTWLQKYNQTIFASACNDGLVNFWDIRKMRLVKQVEMPAHGSISALQFAKKRQYMLVAHDHKLSVINISTDSATSSQSSTAKSQHKSFTVMANNQEAPPTVTGRNCHALATENSWGNGAKITAMVYSEADKKVYTGGFNKKITVWNLNLDAFS